METKKIVNVKGISNVLSKGDGYVITDDFDKLPRIVYTEGFTTKTGHEVQQGEVGGVFFGKSYEFLKGLRRDGHLSYVNIDSNIGEDVRLERGNVIINSDVFASDLTQLDKCVFVDSSVHLQDNQARVMNAEVMYSNVDDSTLNHSCKIIKSSVLRCEIGLVTSVFDSYVVNSKITGKMVSSSFLHGSDVSYDVVNKDYYIVEAVQNGKTFIPNIDYDMLEKTDDGFYMKLDGDEYVLPGFGNNNWSTIMVENEGGAWENRVVYYKHSPWVDEYRVGGIITEWSDVYLAEMGGELAEISYDSRLVGNMSINPMCKIDGALILGNEDTKTVLNNVKIKKSELYVGYSDIPFDILEHINVIDSTVYAKDVCENVTIVDSLVGTADKPCRLHNDIYIKNSMVGSPRVDNYTEIRNVNIMFDKNSYPKFQITSKESK